MKTIAKAVAVALLTAGTVVVPVSAEAIAAPIHSPAAMAPAAPSFDRDHGPSHHRHGGEVGRYRDHRHPGGYRPRYCDRHHGWDRHRHHNHHSYRWDCYPYGRR
ncbi:hypothetical protein [Streptomyces nodosus]|uniref:hypothetical protein n=1 Tax=Streptomyces nodosus TaxID=40318 RepID=UPI00380CFAD4